MTSVLLLEVTIIDVEGDEDGNGNGDGNGDEHIGLRRPVLLLVVMLAVVVIAGLVRGGSNIEYLSKDGTRLASWLGGDVGKVKVEVVC